MRPEPTDISLGPERYEESDKLLAHRVDCVFVRMQADLGLPVFTMFGMKEPLPADVQRHSCLDEEE